MASFTDSPNIQFNTYVDTLQTDALTRVEMAKQEQFNQGFEKIQGQFSAIMGLPVAKQETKDYIQSKLSQLKNNIATSTTGDFSDMRLLNQIGGLTGRIANDPIVQNGVQSTARAQQAFQQMQEDQKAGKLTPQNQYDFEEQYNKWISDGRADTVFDADYYSHVDYKKMFLDAYNAKHPSSTLTQDDIRLDDSSIENGKGAIALINESTHKGIDPKDIQGIWNEISSDPSVQNQLRIDAKFHYRGMDGQSIYNQLKDNYQQNIDLINKKINSIKSDAAISKRYSSEQIQNTINSLHDTMDSYAMEFNQAMDYLNNNDIDTAKTMLFSRDYGLQLATNYSWSEISNVVKESPYFNAHMALLNYSLNKGRAEDEAKYRALEYDLHKQEFNLKYRKAIAGQIGGGILADGTESISGAIPTDKVNADRTEETYNQKTKVLSDQLTQAQLGLAWQKYNMQGDDLSNSPVKKMPDGSFQYNYGQGAPFKNMAEAAIQFQKDYASMYNENKSGNPRKFVADGFSTIDDLLDNVVNRNQKASEIINKTTTILQPVKNQIEQQTKSITPVTVSFPKLDNKYSNDPFAKAHQILYGNSWDITAADVIDAIHGSSSKIRIDTSEHADNPRIFLKKGSQEAELTGVGAYDKIMGLYRKVNSKLNSIKDYPEYKTAMENRQKDFKNLQSSFDPVQTTILASDPKSKEEFRQLFDNIAQSRNVNGNTNDFRKLLSKSGNSTDDKVVNSNIYSTIYDRNTNKYYIVVSHDGKDDQLEVDASAFRKLGINPSNPAWDKYGNKLEINEGANTGSSIENAYRMHAPAGSKYQVKYHLINNGDDTYSVKLFIQDQTGKLVASPIVEMNKTIEDIYTGMEVNPLQDADIDNILKSSAKQ